MTITKHERDAFRLAIAKRETPRALAWTALCIGALSVFNALGGTFTGWAFALHIAVVLTLLAAAVLVSRPLVRPPLVPWIVAVCSAAVVGSLLLEVWINPTALGMAYVLLAMLAYGPFTMAPWAMATAGVPMLAACVVTARHGEPSLLPADAVDWFSAAVAALFIGAVLLRIRLRAFDELGEMTLLAEARATRDPLTGVLNRHGIEDRVRELIAVAQRQASHVFVSFVDVDGLKSANDDHGHDFGDEVLNVVAAAMTSCARAGDLVGRWGGDEFLVLGMGDAQVPTAFSDRLSTSIARSGIDISKWPGSVSVGAVTAPAVDLDFDTLVRLADENMYAMRRRRRSGDEGESTPRSEWQPPSARA